MMSHSIISGLKIKQLVKASGLTPREVDILLAIRFAGSLATPTLNRLLKVSRADMNRIIGPKLVEEGWLIRRDATHRRRGGYPTFRWSIPEDKLEDLRQLEETAQENLNELMNLSFVKDLNWIVDGEVAC